MLERLLSKGMQDCQDRLFKVLSLASESQAVSDALGDSFIHHGLPSGSALDPGITKECANADVGGEGDLGSGCES